MNSSLRTADPTTHLKIVVVSLMAAIVVTVVGITAHISDSRSATFAMQIDRTVVTAGNPASVAAIDNPTIR
jgi:hypothetical protein